MTHNNYAEIEFLRHFFASASDYMGPADRDIYQNIADCYRDAGGSIPTEDFYLGYLFHTEK